MSNREPCVRAQPSQFVIYHPSQFIFYHPSQFVIHHPSRFIFGMKGISHHHPHKHALSSLFPP